MNLAPFQTAFDAATSALLKQGCKSSMASGSCFYRHPNNGSKCAVGQLLSDEQIEKYSLREGDSVQSFADALILELVPEADECDARRFLAELQRAHDLSCDTDFVPSFTAAANLVATQWGLVPIK
jgi:hypothetical protein